jgi:ABC-2 type transport system permease protein
MQKAKAYWRVFKTAAREDGANPKRLISSVVQMVLRVLLVVAIYKVAYQAAGSANASLDFTNAMWTVGLCFAFFLNLAIRNLYQPVEREIKDGTVETSFIKPLDWRVVTFVRLLGKSGIEFLIQLIVLPTVLLLTVGPPSIAHLHPAMAAIFTVLFVMSVTTAGAMFMTVGLSAFWLNDARSVFRIVDKMALICCGTFVPLALMPDIMQKIVQFTPFYIYAAPTRVFDPTFVPSMGIALLSGAIWMAIMLVFCQVVWRRAGRRIEVNGG